VEGSSSSESVTAVGSHNGRNDQPAMVSEWTVYGNINEFVKAHRGVNRFELVGR